MRRVKLSLSVLAFTLVLSLFTAVVSGQDVQITILNSKGEIQAQLEEIAAYYSSITEGVTVEVIAAPVRQSPFERASMRRPS